MMNALLKLRNRFLWCCAVFLTFSAPALLKKWHATPDRSARHNTFRDPTRGVSVEPAIFPNIARVVRTANAQTSNPPDADNALRAARNALAKGNLDEALQDCRESIQMYPQSSLAYFLMGMIQIRRGDEEEARKALLQSLKLDPTHGATHYYLGKIYFAASEFSAATNEFDAAIKLGDPSGAAHFGLALTLLAESRGDEAIPHLRIAVKGNPQDPERLFALVGAELQVKQVDQARRDVVQIKERFPRDPALAYRLGKALLEYSLPEDAESEFERASSLLAEMGNSAPALNASDLQLQLARLRFDHRDYRGALESLAKIKIADVAAALQPSALHLEGQALVAVGKAPEAVGKLRQAAEMNPANPEYFVHLAWADLLAGDRQSALTTTEFAQNKWPNVPDIQLMRTLLKRESNASRRRVALSQPWRVKGEGLVCCPCKTPCPCRSNGHPTHPHCENTGLIRIEHGHYGNISLDGFTFVMVNNEMETGTSPDVLYVEPSATDEQLIALERIMQSFNPVQPSVLLNVHRAPILFLDRADNIYEVRIPKLLAIRIRRELNSKGAPFFHTAAVDQFSNTIEYAKNLTYKFWDQNGGLRWDYSGRQANFRIIDLDSTAYTTQTMLIQFADNSGAFNKKQLELIASQKLPLPHNHPDSTELPHKK